MYAFEISDFVRTRAEKLYGFDSLNNSITNGRSNIYGALGECVFELIYCDMYVRESTLDYDFMSLDGKVTVDIKTKRTTAVPQDNWKCSVAASNTRQKCDYYFFIRVNEAMTTAYLLGYLGKDEFFEKAEFFKKGEPDPDKPEWKFTADCYNVKISDLRSIHRRGDPAFPVDVQMGNLT